MHFRRKRPATCCECVIISLSAHHCANEIPTLSIAEGIVVFPGQWVEALGSFAPQKHELVKATASICATFVKHVAFASEFVEWSGMSFYDKKYFIISNKCAYMVIDCFIYNV